MPTIDTGTATSGISVVLNLPRNKNTAKPTRMIASASVQMTSSIVFHPDNRTVRICAQDDGGEFENCSGVVSRVPTLIGRGLYSSSSGDEISMPKPARPTYDFGRGVPSRIRIAQLELWKPYNGVRLDRASPPDRLRRHVSGTTSMDYPFSVGLCF